MSNELMDEITVDYSLSKFILKKTSKSEKGAFCELNKLHDLKKRYRETPVEVCIERAKLITEYMKKSEDSGEPIIIRRAKAISYYLRTRKIVFFNDNLLAGSSTSKELGAPVYPEQLGLSIWPELDTISTRQNNPQKLTEEEANELNFEIFPYWLDRTILELTRKRLKEESSHVYESLKIMEKIAFFTAGKTATISHTTPYYEEVLAKGLNAIIDEAHKKENELGETGNNKDKQKKKDFYRAMLIAMQGIIDYSKNIANAAEEQAKSAKGYRKKLLEEMAEVCKNVPAGPASDFREAVNSLWLCHIGILAENVNMAFNPGRLDQVLYPYFKKDIDLDRLTIEEAMNLVGCLWLKIADNTNLVPESAEKLFGGAGSVPAVTLGGITKDNKDGVNELTYIMLRITELLAIKDPNVNARYHNEFNKPEYRDRIAQVILTTRAIPAVYNDKINVETLKNQGVSGEHANDYAIVGCVELGSAGREFMSSSSILMNLSAALEMVFYNGKRPYISGNWQIGTETGRPDSFKTFEEFRDAFEKQLGSLIDRAVDLNNELGKTHQAWLPEPLLSCFFQGPMENGKDLLDGGALYNSSGATHIAFADVCDSLNAVEDIVYRKKKIKLSELWNAVEKNFEGYEDIHNYLINIAPKFGMDDSIEEHPIAVKNSKNLIEYIYKKYQGKVNYRGGKYRPAYWTMTNHAGYGTIAKALPSGRKANEVFSSGITPASQCAKDLTGAYNSVAKLCGNAIPGGIALNMKYTPVPENGKNKKNIDLFAKYLEGYFNSGGMQVQFNIHTYQDLMDAKNNPEKYKDLLVRVSGYSAYFYDLNNSMKHELITRTQYNLDTGGAVPLNSDNEGGEQ